MEGIKYVKRICSDEDKINAFLSSARTGVIGMNYPEYPYCVPVNFIWHNKAVYFHGMGSGKKFDILSEGPNVCFSVYEEIGTVTDPVPCHADTSYFSVILFGKANKVTDSGEAAEALQVLLDKFMPDFYKQKITKTLVEKYHSSMDGNKVGVFRIDIHNITAKENIVDTDSLFQNGHE